MNRPAYKTSRVYVVNNTDARMTPAMEIALCEYARKDAPLPAVYFDAFAVSKFDVPADVVGGGGVQTRVIVNWR